MTSGTVEAGLAGGFVGGGREALDRACKMGRGCVEGLDGDTVDSVSARFTGLAACTPTTVLSESWDVRRLFFGRSSLSSSERFRLGRTFSRSSGVKLMEASRLTSTTCPSSSVVLLSDRLPQ